jgi:hypothetical protein
MQNVFIKLIFPLFRIGAGRRLLLPLLLVGLQRLCWADVQVTGKELEFYAAPEYNRAFYFCWDVQAELSVMLNNRYVIRGGLAAGFTGNVFDMKSFAEGEAALFKRVPLYLSFAYKFNGLPEYESYSHSIPLLASLKWERAGVSLGPTFRFSSFFGGTPVFEPILSFSVYVFLVKNNFLKCALKCANFDDFSSGNFGSYFLNLSGVIRLGRKFSLVNEIEVHQSGSAALTSGFYGIVYRGGAAFSW